MAAIALKRRQFLLGDLKPFQGFERLGITFGRRCAVGLEVVLGFLDGLLEIASDIAGDVYVRGRL